MDGLVMHLLEMYYELTELFDCSFDLGFGLSCSFLSLVGTMLTIFIHLFLFIFVIDLFITYYVFTIKWLFDAFIAILKKKINIYYEFIIYHFIHFD